MSTRSWGSKPSLLSGFITIVGEVHIRVRLEWNSGQNFFSLFLDLSQPGLDRNNAGMMFFNFLNFFSFFFLEFSSPGRVGTEFGTKFFFLFLSLSKPGFERNIAEMMFFNFLILFLFFREFSFLGQVGTEVGTKISSLFFGLSQPGLDRTTARMKFFNFLNFFAIFLGIFFPESGRNRIRDKKFFLSSSAYLILVLIEIMQE